MHTNDRNTYLKKFETEQLQNFQNNKERTHIKIQKDWWKNIKIINCKNSIKTHHSHHFPSSPLVWPSAYGTALSHLPLAITFAHAHPLLYSALMTSHTSGTRVMPLNLKQKNKELIWSKFPYPQPSWFSIVLRQSRIGIFVLHDALLSNSLAHFCIQFPLFFRICTLFANCYTAAWVRSVAHTVPFLVVSLTKLTYVGKNQLAHRVCTATEQPTRSDGSSWDCYFTIHEKNLKKSSPLLRGVSGLVPSTNGCSTKYQKKFFINKKLPNLDNIQDKLDAVPIFHEWHGYPRVASVSDELDSMAHPAVQLKDWNIKKFEFSGKLTS